ncbi:unnamed protein product [Paramecium primaurelia]|uniref:Uncharacterized protein n=1 Tax=Paramecium primaurelia TaxID=5886 RepID=A0A8S1PEA1_PARPR|nr:unnamed protein product [Paramecium primaurelia]
MLNIILLFNIVSNIVGQTCSVNAITCESIIDINICQQAKDSNNNSICEWNSNQCEKSILNKLPCLSYTNEFTCLYRSYGCRWDGVNTTNYDTEIMKTNQQGKCVDKKCEDSTNDYDCESFGQISCEWQNEKCVQVTKCVDFQSVKGCRNTRFKEKCVPIVNGEVFPIESRTTTIFDTFECIVQECKHKKYDYECTFVNGIQCIWGTDGCSVCSSYTSYQSCIGNKGLCLWNQNQCQNIECQQYKSPNLCNIKSEQCEWNQQKMRCQLNTTNSNQHCYSEYLDQQNVSYIIQIMIIIHLILIG